MNADQKIFFVDTNLFLQCKDLKDLDWSEISSDRDILLIISRAVQREIDRLKGDGNSRRAKRARASSSIMRSMILPRETKSVIRDSNPHVELSFSDVFSGRNPEPDILDLTHNDDQIIAEALLYRRRNPGSNVALLTHDTNPMLTAQRCGLASEVIPDDWLLKPEQDSREKRITELENELKKYKESSPIIEITAQGEKAIDIEDIEFAITLYNDLSDDEIEELSNSVFQNYPLKTSFDRDSQIKPPRLGAAEAQFMKWEYRPPRKEEIEQYQNVDYPKWQDKVKGFFKHLAYNQEYPSRNATITIIINNQGGEPAENVIVEFEALGGILFQPPSNGKERIEKILLPGPPEPPEGNWFKTTTGSSALDFFQNFKSPIPELASRNIYSPAFSIPQLTSIPHKRDKNAFYWNCERPYERTSKWSFECDEFRHKFKSKGFEITAFVPRGNLLKKGAIRCKVTANNLQEPFEKTFPVKIKYTDGDISKIANDYIDSEKDSKLLIGLKPDIFS